jgi:hypothetical protein
VLHYAAMCALPRAAARSLLAILTLLGMLVPVLATVDVASAAPKAELRPSSAGRGYTALSPARLLDTRPGTATIDGLYVGTGAVEHFFDLPVRGRGGVPSSGVRSVALNVTVTAPTSTSFLTAWPAGEAQPNASNINFVPGQTVANAVIVKLGDNGSISFFNETGTTHLIVDVVGWFASDSDYTPQVPARILDTRPDGQTIDGAFRGGAQPANTPIALTVAPRAGVPAYATAVVLNVTIVAPSANSFATVWPHGSDIPNASNLNFEAGRNVANLVVVEVGADGRVDLNFAAGTAFVLADLVGWFGDAFEYEPVLPARLLDTRSPNATIDGLFSGGGALAGGGRLDLHVLGRGGVPSAGVDSVVVNVTATQPTSGSFVTVWPTDGQGPPNASTLNLVAGRTVPNLAIVKVGASGNISLFNEQGLTQLIVDVVGWFPTTLEIDSTSLTPGVVGSLFTQTLGTVGGTGATAWAFADEAPGLTGSSSGTVTGTPTVPGTYATLALVADSGGGLAARSLPHHIFSAADGFTPVTKSTLFDSFAGGSPIPGNSTRTFTAGGVGGVPADAKAAVVDVVAKSPAANFLTVWQAGGPQPDVAMMNMVAGIQEAGVLVIPLSAGGQFNVANFGTADYRLELLGYFGAASNYQALLPVRVHDSRTGAGMLNPGETRMVAMGGFSASATAVVLNVWAVDAAGSGSFDVVPSGTTPQSETTFDFGPGTSLQTVVIPLSSFAIDVRNRVGGSSTHLIVDVVGYFEP